MFNLTCVRVFNSILLIQSNLLHLQVRHSVTFTAHLKTVFMDICSLYIYLIFVTFYNKPEWYKNKGILMNGFPGVK